MNALAGVFLLLWSLVGGQYQWHNIDRYGDGLRLGAFSCESGEGWISPDAPLSIVVHELAHAYDCSDDGELNGSPGHAPQFHVSPALLASWGPGYNWRAEWYAQEVVRTGRLR